MTPFDEWLGRQGTCLILAPHHDVGFTGDMQQRQMEYKHHGDELVPRQQRFGQYTRSLMKGLEVPVLNQFGLRPAVVQGTDQIAPLTINQDLDRLGLLNGVTTFNFHLHLPHYAVTTEDTKSIHVLARQPIDLSRPHPFTAAGNREFNSLIWMPPNGTRGGDIMLADSTIFTTLFGGTESLRTLLAERGKAALTILEGSGTGDSSARVSWTWRFTGRRHLARLRWVRAVSRIDWSEWPGRHRSDARPLRLLWNLLTGRRPGGNRPRRRSLADTALSEPVGPGGALAG